ncbi:alpha/beta hydrolase [Brevirhabdus sp.]|uniref:alpha/beta hydrolase n=1 Tax=Brevirhabdus sp. TaxID=2004514 RepID=UPI00405A1722
MNTRVLQSGRRPAASGRTGSVVVLLHGYGADGTDLLGLADPLAPHMPDTTFVAPNAPETCIGNPMGFQWFPIPWLDGSSQEEAETGMGRALDDLNAYLDAVIEEEGITPEKLVILGFSQGTMMALHLAPRREAAVAGVVGFSGRLLEPDRLAEDARVKPPVLLVHGDQDDVVPPDSLPEAADALTAAGFEVYAHISKGTAHGIAPDGLSIAAAFMKEKLDA